MWALPIPAVKRRACPTSPLRPDPARPSALSAETGSGKSTLVNLIHGSGDCTHGEVRLFGRNVRDYDAAALRQAVGVVPQRARLFSGTIRSNL